MDKRLRATQHIMLADMEMGGKLRKVLMQAPNDFFYVIDRETGKSISAKPTVSANWATCIDRYCAVCDAPGAIGATALPDLRRAGSLESAQAGGAR